MNRIQITIVLLFLIFGIEFCVAQQYNYVVEPSGVRIIKGVFTRPDIENDSIFTWYRPNYNYYPIDSSTLKEIDSLSKNIHFVLIVGTWCGDSKREVPYLFKIFDAAKINSNKVWMFGVDRSKKSEDSTTIKYNVLRVPTLIVFKEEQELGRIVENPRETLEKDLLRILRKQ